MKYDLTIITPTGDRPEAFALCERWMARQTYKGRIQWLVLDNGHEPVNCTMGQTHHVMEPDHETGKRSLASKIKLACDMAEATLVTIAEDDDWYAPAHLAKLVGRLNDAEVVGTTEQRYYNLLHRRYWQGTNFGSCLCATGLRRSMLPTLKAAAQNAYDTNGTLCVDRNFWSMVAGNRPTVRCSTDLYAKGTFVGVKGMPGREGLGAGHHPNDKWYSDPEGAKLREWLGAEAEPYLEIMNRTERKSGMKVKATSKGYYGGKIREPGDEFEIVSMQEFSRRWMVKMEPMHQGPGAAPEAGRPPGGGNSPRRRKPGPKPKNKPQQDQQNEPESGGIGPALE